MVVALAAGCKTPRAQPLARQGCGRMEVRLARVGISSCHVVRHVCERTEAKNRVPHVVSARQGARVQNVAEFRGNFAGEMCCAHAEISRNSAECCGMLRNSALAADFGKYNGLHVAVPPGGGGQPVRRGEWCVGHQPPPTQPGCVGVGPPSLLPKPFSEKSRKAFRSARCASSARGLAGPPAPAEAAAEALTS